MSDLTADNASPSGHGALILPGNVGNEEQPTGVHFIPGATCVYPGFIEARAVVEVDFDKRDVRQVDGLYFLGLSEPPFINWHGVRRFHLRVNGTVEVDQDGHGDWVPLDMATTDFRVMGFVREVYRPTLKGKA